jgi:hypothetical protein
MGTLFEVRTGIMTQQFSVYPAESERMPQEFGGEASPLARMLLRATPLCGGSAPATPPRFFFFGEGSAVVFIPKGV